jgi:hypothetical protein
MLLLIVANYDILEVIGGDKMIVYYKLDSLLENKGIKKLICNAN